MTNYNKKSLSFAVVVMLGLVMCILGLTVQAQPASPDEATPEAAVYTDSILSSAEISLGKDDSVIRTDGRGYVTLTIVRAFDVKINYCGAELTVKCSEGTVADAIQKAGIALTSAQKVNPALDTELTPDCSIYILSDSGVTLTIGSESNNYITKSETVQEFLDEIGVTLDKDDIIKPNLSDSIYEGMAVTINRVEYKEETTTQVIDYGYVSEETSSLISGTSQIKQYGIEGERTITSRNMYIDGELAESVVISDEVTLEPVDQIKLIGTGKAPSYESSSPSKPSSGNSSVDNAAGTFTDSDGNTVAYKKKLTGASTAYYAAEGAITATGVPVYMGGVAVNPNVIPYGSKLYIVSSDGSKVYGYATAVDTGGALMSGSVLVDVFYPTYNQCMSWGRRNVTVYVLS